MGLDSVFYSLVILLRCPLSAGVTERQAGRQRDRQTERNNMGSLGLPVQKLNKVQGFKYSVGQFTKLNIISFLNKKK